MFYVAAVVLGLALGAMCLGIFISLRIFNFPDITTDGSYTLGAAITAVGIVSGLPLWVIFIMVILSGMLSGMSTGLIHTGMKLNSLLSGILVMTGLYSVNLAILGRSNVPLPPGSDNLFRLFTDYAARSVWTDFAILGTILLLFAFFLRWLLKTDFGLAMRATGNNPVMARGLGMNANALKIAGLSIANGFTAISGFLVTQYQGYADINMGIGIVIIGLGAVMIGESLMNLFNVRSLMLRVLGVIAGSIVFRLILSFALTAGVDPKWLKLITAVFVLLIIGLPNMIPSVKRRLNPD